MAVGSARHEPVRRCWLHAGHGEHSDLEEACLQAFDLAVADVGFSGDVARLISAYFRRATEAQREWGDPKTSVPDGLPFNRE